MAYTVLFDLVGPVSLLNTRVPLGSVSKVTEYFFPSRTPHPLWSRLRQSAQPPGRPIVQKLLNLKNSRPCVNQRSILRTRTIQMLDQRSILGIRMVQMLDQGSILRSRTVQMLMGQLEHRSQESKLCHQPRMGEILSVLPLKLAQVLLSQLVGHHLR